ncbi:MAG: prolyl oligopeptidase family serine peptidase [Arenimonas sp.]
MLLAFDTNRLIASTDFVEKDSYKNVFEIEKPAVGMHVYLMVAKAGKYKWSSLELPLSSISLYSGDKTDFEVKPGVFNYPGDFIYRFTKFQSTYHRANRGLAHILWYRKMHPALSEKFPFAYVGKFPDPFPDFLAGENSGGIVEGKTKPIPPTPPINLTTDLLWKGTEILHAWISPNGQYIVEERRKTNDIIHYATGQVTKLDSWINMRDVQWLNEDSFIVTYGSSNASQYVKVKAGADGKITYSATRLFIDGVVIDPQVNNPDYFLYAGESTTTAGRMLVYSLSKNNPASLHEKMTYRNQNAGNLKLDNFIQWITDRDGQIVAGVKWISDKKLMFQKRVGRNFVDIKQIEEDGIWPVALSPDGTRVFAISGEKSAQKELVSANSETLDDIKPVFHMPGKDIVSIIYDENRQPAGIRYYSEGMLVSHYFDDASALIQKRLSKTFPHSNIAVVHKNKTNEKSLVYVDSPMDPGSLYYYDQAGNQMSKLDEQASWLSAFTFSDTKTIIARSKDGLELEGYLTIPAKKSDRPVPLIVVPHGGPIGVRDDLHFDRETQFLAGLGYAVLKVNYRGSDGFGKAFMEAGKQSLGTKIEEDIETVLQKALDTGMIDSQRMCILGSSYGGYSALVSVARWPDRYRCAISVSGVSDRILLFTASDGALDEETQKWMKEYLGDPTAQKEKMISEQPLYMYKKIKVPVMLVHGTDDQRVDYENALRMQYMLTISGNIPVMLTLKGEGHGYESAASRKLAWESIAGFLKENLDAISTTSALPVTQSK